MLLEKEKEVLKWKSITLTNYRAIQKKGIIWTHYKDINYDHISSIYIGRSPLWNWIFFGIVLIVLLVLFQLIVGNFSVMILLIAFISLIVGVIGETKTIIYGTNSKIEERGASLSFMKKINELRLKYKEKL